MARPVYQSKNENKTIPKRSFFVFLFFSQFFRCLLNGKLVQFRNALRRDIRNEGEPMENLLFVVLSANCSITLSVVEHRDAQREGKRECC